MNQKSYREIVVFVTGTTPQIVTETLYGLTQGCQSPVIPDEIHVLTTLEGKRRIEEDLISKGRLSEFAKEFGLPKVCLDESSIHIVRSESGEPLEDIREASQNEAVGNFIINFVREKAQDLGSRLHCSLAGGRKTMSFYLGSALQLFGRPWDKLYHVLVSPEFESHPEFCYKPRHNKILTFRDSDRKVIKRLRTEDARIVLAELPFVRLRDKIALDGKGFKEMVREGQREIDIASVPPPLTMDLQERVISFGQKTVEMVPIQMVIYGYLLRQKLKACSFPDRPYCLNCTECFPALADLSKRKAFEEMVKDYQRIYSPSSARVEEFISHWEKRGGIDPDTLRQNISKVNTVLREQLTDPFELSHFMITPVGKHGSKRYGIRAEKGKIAIR